MKGVIFIIISASLVFVLGKEAQKVTAKDETPGFYLYVFDREKEVWNRATKADLKSAKCEDLRMFPTHATMKAEEGP